MKRFRLKRLEKVSAEALLIASGRNFKRLLRFGTRRPKASAQATAAWRPEIPCEPLTTSPKASLNELLRFY